MKDSAGANQHSEHGPIPPDELIDALFDGELSSKARREVLGAVRRDARAGADLERTARVLAELRTPPAAPDLTNRILEHADNRRRFLPRRMRRMTRVARSGVVALALLAMLGIAAGRRAWPEQTTLADDQTLLADVNEAFHEDAAAGVGAFRSSIERVRFSLETVSCSSQTADCAPRDQARPSMLTAGAVPALVPAVEDLSFGPAPAAPPSVRCSTTRLGAGPAIWGVTEVRQRRSPGAP